MQVQEFIYEKEIESIKRILGDIYAYHDFAMYMMDVDVVAGFLFTIYTKASLDDIGNRVMERLQRYVNQFEVPVTIEIEEESEEGFRDDDKKLSISNLKTIVEKYENE